MSKDFDGENHAGNIFSLLFFGSIILFIPLVKFLSIYGIIIWAILYGITLFWGCKVEKIKKNNDIHTYKEIVAFMDGRRLDEIKQQQEIGKRPYQAVLKPLMGAVVALVLLSFMKWVFGGI